MAWWLLVSSWAMAFEHDGQKASESRAWHFYHQIAGGTGDKRMERHWGQG
jgi:hypothetical protein